MLKSRRNSSDFYASDGGETGPEAALFMVAAAVRGAAGKSFGPAGDPPVARCLGRRCSFVPLLLHGPPGTGKTHLAEALYAFAEPHYSCRRSSAGEWPRWDEEAPSGDLRNCDLLVIEDLHHLPAWAANSLAEILDRRVAHRRATLITAGRGPAELENVPAPFGEPLDVGTDGRPRSARRAKPPCDAGTAGGGSKDRHERRGLGLAGGEYARQRPPIARGGGPPPGSGRRGAAGRWSYPKFRR